MNKKNKDPQTLTDIEQVKEFLVWSRKNRFNLMSVHYKDLAISVHDMGPESKRTVPTGPTQGNSKSLYAAYGGDALEQAMSQLPGMPEVSNDTYMEDDDDE